MTRLLGLLCVLTLALSLPDRSDARPVNAAVTQAPKGATDAAGSMFEAMRTRNVEALGDRLSGTTEPQILYYWGETVRGRDTILQWHREWFAEQGWSLAPEKLIDAVADDQLATLAYTVEYIKNPTRKFDILISLTLIREPAGWKVARVQQTLLKGPYS